MLRRSLAAATLCAAAVLAPVLTTTTAHAAAPVRTADVPGPHCPGLAPDGATYLTTVIRQPGYYYVDIYKSAAGTKIEVRCPQVPPPVD